MANDKETMYIRLNNPQAIRNFVSATMDIVDAAEKMAIAYDKQERVDSARARYDRARRYFDEMLGEIEVSKAQAEKARIINRLVNG